MAEATGLADPLSVNPQVFTPFTQQLTQQAGSIAEKTANKRITAQKAVNDFKDLPYGWIRHDTEISLMQNKLKNTVAAVRDLDLTRINDPKVQKFLSDENSQKAYITKAANYSNQLKQEYAKDAPYITEPTNARNYTPESVALLTEYYAKPLAEHIAGNVKKPVLVLQEKTFDLGEDVRKNVLPSMGVITEKKTFAKPSSDVPGAIETTTIESIPQEKIVTEAAKRFNSPDVMKRANEEYLDLEEDENKQKYMTIGDKKVPVKNSFDYYVNQYYPYHKEVSSTRMTKGQESKIGKLRSSGGGRFENNKAWAEYRKTSDNTEIISFGTLDAKENPYLEFDYEGETLTGTPKRIEKKEGGTPYLVVDVPEYMPKLDADDNPTGQYVKTGKKGEKQIPYDKFSSKITGNYGVNYFEIKNGMEDKKVEVDRLPDINKKSVQTKFKNVPKGGFN